MSKKDEKDRHPVLSEAEAIISSLLEGTTNLKNVLEDRPIPRCPDFKTVEYGVGPNDPLGVCRGLYNIDPRLGAYDEQFSRRMPMLSERIYVRLPWQFEYADIKEYVVGYTGLHKFVLEGFKELDESIMELTLDSFGELWAFREYELRLYIDKVKGDMY